MPTTVTDSSAIANGMVNLGARTAAITHPVYDAFRREWIELGDVREGTGGFKTGEYLIAHPREWVDHEAENPKKPGKKLKMRRKLASYDNLAEGILDSKKTALFREKPLRRAGNGESETPSAIEQWWENVDGYGCHIDDVMPGWWDLGATFGHVVLYFELPEQTEGYTAADSGMPYVRIYTPLDVINWLTDDNGMITSLKMVEALPIEKFEEASKQSQYRIRIVDDETWQLYTYKTGQAIQQGVHALGKLPCVYLYGRRRAVITDVGKSVLGDPKQFIDVYNLESEMRELLRNQTFSFINLPLGTGQDAMDVEKAQAMLGKQTGTMNVLFSGQQAAMLSADPANVKAYEDRISAKCRAIYRQAGVPWESDSKDAESAQSLGLKREELKSRLAAYADECEQAEYQLAELFYRWEYGESWESRYDADQVVIKYPDDFGSTPFDEIIKQVQASDAIGMPIEFKREQMKAIIGKFEGMSNLTVDKMKEIVAAIEKIQEEPTPMEMMQQRATIMAGRPINEG